MSPRVLLLLSSACAVLIGAGPSGAATRSKPVGLASSPDLWATVNVCDTMALPNTIGIRGSMPGLGPRRPSTLWMRFQVQYMAAADGKWHNIDDIADSEWKRVGRAREAVIESGQNFEFDPPVGGVHTLRGAVSFKWVRNRRVVKRLRELTEAGHRSTAGADPEGFSAAICQIS